MAQSSNTKMLNNNSKHPNQEGDTPINGNLKSYNKPNFSITQNTAKPSRVVRKEDVDDGSDVSTMQRLLVNRQLTTQVIAMAIIQGNY